MQLAMDDFESFLEQDEEGRETGIFAGFLEALYGFEDDREESKRHFLERTPRVAHIRDPNVAMRACLEMKQLWMTRPQVEDRVDTSGSGDGEEE
jgi:hypothetical protein